jgi:hypothetical protein
LEITVSGGMRKFAKVRRRDILKSLLITYTYGILVSYPLGIPHEI